MNFINRVAHPHHSFSSVSNMIKQENLSVRKSTLRTLGFFQDGMQLVQLLYVEGAASEVIKAHTAVVPENLERLQCSGEVTAPQNIHLTASFFHHLCILGQTHQLCANTLSKCLVLTSRRSPSMK